MTPIKRLFALFGVLALATLACSFTVDLGTSPSGAATPTLSGGNEISTMVAQTLESLTQEAAAATPADTSTPAATPTPTNTPLPPTLSVSVATNCYAGPSTHYGFVITIYPGMTVTVTGKDIADDYWIIDVPNYPGTICWLSGQYASVSGDSNNVPVPATPVISIYTLDEPTNLRVACHRVAWPTPTGTPPPWWGHGWHGGYVTVVLHWRNTDPDQTGVRIYRNGYRITTLGGGATSFTDDSGGWGGWGWNGGGATYGIQAVNSSEVSSIVTGSCN
ncbi:MAG TPA: hypothetical protein VLX61_15660 [Anaerolineales bacterium]|nr:hypothetical protein [Anaerolineales bacterium]